MPDNTIREQTYCCGGGSGLNAGEYDVSCVCSGGLPQGQRGQAIVHEKHGVNTLACVCAIDRAALPPLMDYWVPGVDVTGVHELVANALVMEGEQKREYDLRGEDLPNLEPDEGGSQEGAEEGEE